MEIQLSDVRIVQAQNRLLRLYKRFRRKGGWRAVTNYIGLKNVSYVHRFVKHGKLPGNPEIRKVLLRARSQRKKEPMEMNPLMQRLQYVMRTFHVGRKKAIKMKDLLIEIYGEYAVEDESKNNPYDRELRSMIETFNRDYSGLICSAPNIGYFWASGLGEGLEAVDQSTRRAVTQMDNARHLERNLQRAFGGQLEMKV